MSAVFVLLTGIAHVALAGTSPDWDELPNEVRVFIFGHSSLDNVQVTPRAASIELIADGETVVVSADESIFLSRAGHQVEVLFGKDSMVPRKIHLKSNPSGAFDVRISSGSETRTYSGSLEVSAEHDRLRLINLVPIEDYVASVVGSEYGLDDEEGMKAMAVVARTYALYTLQQNRDLNDSERSQVYRGLQKATAQTRAAAEATRGEILTHDDNLIEAVYSASNGGRTASNESAWGSSELPYFRSRKDPWDARISPHASWTWEVSEKDLEKAASRAFGMDVRKVQVRETAKDGRVIEVRLEGRGTDKTISGSSFRAAMARTFGAMTLKSAYFDMSSKRNRYVFKGHGFGHGVGLSQWGAHGMARAGHGYEEILDFYYRGTDIETMPGADTIPASIASSESTDGTLTAETVWGQKEDDVNPSNDVNVRDGVEARDNPSDQKDQSKDDEKKEVEADEEDEKESKPKKRRGW
ncbi:MAG: SpoIID/LytB domain-containing protein [Bacteroidota bacterium]|nr:SpoIID/LytB domain-containing protein [Bacteroidota bacterium]